MPRMAKQKPQPPATKRTREGVNINVWVEPELGEAFEKYLEEVRPKPTRKTAVEAALELLLTQAGRWPRK